MKKYFKIVLRCFLFTFILTWVVMSFTSQNPQVIARTIFILIIAFFIALTRHYIKKKKAAKNV